jgi:hypothetical protein
VSTKQKVWECRTEKASFGAMPRALLCNTQGNFAAALLEHLLKFLENCARTNTARRQECLSRIKQTRVELRCH